MGLRNKQFARGSAGWLLIKSCKYKVSADVCSFADPMQSRRCTFDPHGLTGAHDVYCSVPARKTISYGSFPGWRSGKLDEVFRKKWHTTSLGTVYLSRTFEKTIPVLLFRASFRDIRFFFILTRNRHKSMMGPRWWPFEIYCIYLVDTVRWYMRPIYAHVLDLFYVMRDGKVMSVRRNLALR